MISYYSLFVVDSILVVRLKEVLKEVEEEVMGLTLVKLGMLGLV